MILGMSLKSKLEIREKPEMGAQWILEIFSVMFLFLKQYFIPFFIFFVWTSGVLWDGRGLGKAKDFSNKHEDKQKRKL